MVTFEEIKKANESISTTDVKGKEYAEVNQRVIAFRTVYPTGFILPSAVIDENGACTYVCEVGYYTEGGARILLARGSAKEEKNSSYINKTSYLENCETSAVGRALGFCGFGIDTSICSADELKNALNSQEAAKTEKKKDPEIAALRSQLTEKIKKIMSATGRTMNTESEIICNKCNINKPETADDYKAMIAVADDIINTYYGSTDGLI